MIPDPYGLYDQGVRSRILWAVREGLVVGGILLFWVALAVVITVVLLVLSLPFALFRFGAPGLPVAGLIWTLVGPLAFLNAMLYVLVRTGTVIVDHYRSDDGSTFERRARANERAERAGTDTEVGPRTDGPEGDSTGTRDETDE